MLRLSFGLLIGLAAVSTLPLDDPTTEQPLSLTTTKTITLEDLKNDEGVEAIRRILSTCSTENPASRRVWEKQLKAIMEFKNFSSVFDEFLGNITATRQAECLPGSHPNLITGGNPKHHMIAASHTFPGPHAQKSSENDQDKSAIQETQNSQQYHSEINLHDLCDDDCGDMIPHMECVNSLCECKSHYFEKDGKCHPGFGADCQKDGDCAQKNLTCLEGTCGCDGHYSPLSGICRKTPTKLDDVCLQDFMCDNIPNSYCPNGKCVCKEHYVERDGRCVAGFGAPCQKDGDCAQKNLTCLQGTCDCDRHYSPLSGICRKTPTKLDDVCLQDFMCDNIPNSYCPNGKCVCKEHYVERDGRCVAGFGAPCQKDGDCAQKNLTCLQGTCDCDGHYSPLSGICRKTPTKLDDVCLQDFMCDNIPNSYCPNGKCVCKEHYVERDGRCVAGFGGPCQKDGDCAQKNLTCLQGTCDCDGHYSPLSGICRNMPTKLDDVCLQDFMCDNIPNSYCPNGKCVCKEHYVERDGRCVAGFGAPCQKDGDCAQKNLTCLQGTCDCDGHYSPLSGICRKTPTKLDDVCLQDFMCDNIPNSYCPNGKCVCKEHYVERDGRCVAGFGAPCQKDGDCAQKNLTCLQGTCDCDGHYSPLSGICRNMPTKLDDVCLQDFMCDNIPNSYCPNGKCVCKEHYVERDGRCVAGFGAPCQKDGDCAQKNLTCLQGTCDCDGHYSPLSGICRKTPTKLDDVCLQDFMCDNIPNSYCPNGKCVCKEHYVERDGRCVAGFGAPCQKDGDCAQKNLTCLQGTCDCDGHYSPLSGICRNMPTKLDDVCLQDFMCDNIPNSYCPNGKCVCKEHYVERDGRCVAGFGAPCQKDGDCAQKNLTCLQGTCDCDGHYSPLSGIFRNMPTKLDDYCHEALPCTGIENSYCRNGKCVCKIHYVERDGRCVAGLGAPCQTEVDCIAVPKSICVAARCTL